MMNELIQTIIYALAGSFIAILSYLVIFLMVGYYKETQKDIVSLYAILKAFVVVVVLVILISITLVFGILGMVNLIKIIPLMWNL